MSYVKAADLGTGKHKKTHTKYKGNNYINGNQHIMLNHRCKVNHN